MAAVCPPPTRDRKPGQHTTGLLLVPLVWAERRRPGTAGGGLRGPRQGALRSPLHTAGEAVRASSVNLSVPRAEATAGELDEIN